MVWLLAVVTGGNQRENKERVFDLKKKDFKTKVFMSNKDKYDCLDVLVSKKEAE